MPIPRDAVASILGGIGGAEGYLSTKHFAVAVFRDKFKDGKVQVPQNMCGAFKDGEDIQVIVMTQRPTKKPPEIKTKKEG